MLLNIKININLIIICLLVRDFIFNVLIMIYINIFEIAYFCVVYIIKIK